MSYTKFLLLLLVLSITGCASSGMNAICASVSGQEMTVPYIGGKGNADIKMCHMGCVGMKCPLPDYSVLQSLTTAYLQTTGNKMSTSGPGTITFTPESK